MIHARSARDSGPWGTRLPRSSTGSRKMGPKLRLREMSVAQRMCPNTIHVGGLESLLMRMLAVLEETLATGRRALRLREQCRCCVVSLPEIHWSEQLLVLGSSVNGNGPVQLGRHRREIEGAPRALD